MTAQSKQFGMRAVAILLVVAFLAFGGLGLTGVAAQSSIPGDALYPVKTSIEQTRLSLAQDAGNRAQMKMAFAQERLEEIDALIQEGRFREVNAAVLAFETNINSAIVELETLSKADPARAAQLALEITAALSRYAQTLSELVARVPDSVKAEVNRALDTTQVVGGMEMPFGNENSNGNDNVDDGNSNVNSNDNDDDSNSNGNGNSNANSNDNDDDSNSNGDDNSNANSNDNDDDSNSNGDDDSDANSNGDDDNSNTNSNDNDDDSNDNGSDDDNSNDNGSNDNTNDNDNDNDNGGDDSGDDNDNDNGND